MISAIIIFIGFVIGWYITESVKTVLDMRQAKKALHNSTWYKDAQRVVTEIEAHQAEFDEHGHRKEYDPHYTRQVEEEQGLKGVLTQCDDTNCTTCYWKARMLNNYNTAIFPPGTPLLRKRQEFIKELPDGLSDELYDSMFLDWGNSEEITNEILAARAKIREQREAKRRTDMEKFYNTPYDQIVEYLTEGRSFSKEANSWGPKPKETPVVKMSVTDKSVTVKVRENGEWRESNSHIIIP